jgi:hypothetical protein
MVNERTAGIFKGIFETQKSTRNGKNFAEMRALRTWGTAVYPVRVNHIGAQGDANGFLTG